MSSINIVITLFSGFMVIRFIHVSSHVATFTTALWVGVTIIGFKWFAIIVLFKYVWFIRMFRATMAHLITLV